MFELFETVQSLFLNEFKCKPLNVNKKNEKA